MTWHSIVAGVDASPEGALAAGAAWRLARATGTPCVLVHALPHVTIPPGARCGAADVAAFRRDVLRVARDRLAESLGSELPADALANIQVRFGRPARVLAMAADEYRAGLLVVGGKRHAERGHWLAGSTAHDTIRTAGVPVLIATTSTTEVRRVLAAVDLSPFAGRTIELAQDLARLVNGELLVLHVVEQLPCAPGIPVPLEPSLLTTAAIDAFHDELWPKVKWHGASRLIRQGRPAQAIAQEAADWDAQIVVVGSHGRGPSDRVLLGNVTESLLRRLPASLVVIPALTAAPRRRVPPRALQAVHNR